MTLKPVRGKSGRSDGLGPQTMGEARALAEAEARAGAGALAGALAGAGAGRRARHTHTPGVGCLMHAPCGGRGRAEPALATRDPGRLRRPHADEASVQEDEYTRTDWAVSRRAAADRCSRPADGLLTGTLRILTVCVTQSARAAALSTSYRQREREPS